MELKEFVTKTILDIVDGVRDAQLVCPEDAEINPGVPPHTEEIEFDIALAESSNTEGVGRTGIVVPLLGLDAGVSAQVQASESNRIRFKVRVRYTTTFGSRSK